VVATQIFVIFTPNPGEIFFKGVGSTTNQIVSERFHEQITSPFELSESNTKHHRVVSRNLGGGVAFFRFSPLPGKMIQFDQYISNGLKPPTSFYPL